MICRERVGAGRLGPAMACRVVGVRRSESGPPREAHAHCCVSAATGTAGVECPKSSERTGRCGRVPGRGPSLSRQYPRSENRRGSDPKAVRASRTPADGTGRRPMWEQIDRPKHRSGLDGTLAGQRFRRQTSWKPKNTMPINLLGPTALGNLRFGRWLVSRRPGTGRPSSRMAARSAQGPYRFKR